MIKVKRRNAFGEASTSSAQQLFSTSVSGRCWTNLQVIIAIGSKSCSTWRNQHNEKRKTWRKEVKILPFKTCVKLLDLRTKRFIKCKNFIRQQLTVKIMWNVASAKLDFIVFNTQHYRASQHQSCPLKIIQNKRLSLSRFRGYRTQMLLPSGP